jgi:rubrerythrin
MRTRAEIAIRGATGVAVLLLATGTLAAEPATLANLQAAFEDDIHAEARYRAFAERAVQERQRDAAALFRAAAHAERVRARSHAEVLRRLGAEPVEPPVREPVVRTTRSNLMSILAHENAERVAVYPRLIDEARRERIPDAILSFTLAHHAEEGLVRLYQDALSKPPAPAESVLHVCETCGHVVRGDPPARCPVSLSSRAAFTAIL